MCAIIGMVGEPKRDHWTEMHRLLTNLLVAAQVRGRDATGFAAVSRPLTSGFGGRVVIDKAALSAEDFVARNDAWRRLRFTRCSIILGHCRLSTSGSPSENANNHPHTSDDGRFVLIHNGIVPQHGLIADQHCLELRSQCDSEVLLRLIETAPNPAEGLADCLRACRSVGGSMAVALLDAMTGAVWLCRDNNRPLWLCRLKKDSPWLFASTPEIVLNALARTFGRNAERQVETMVPVAPDHPHALTVAGLLIAPSPSPVRYQGLAG